MISNLHRSKLLLIHKITVNSFLSPFKDSTFSTHIASPQYLKKKSKCNDYSTKDCSFTVSYLINSCGLSPECAKSASEKVNFRNTERPDSVIKLFNDYGFGKYHIFRLVRCDVRVLTYDPEKTLLPKLRFFRSIGFSKGELASHFSLNPNMLYRSLDNQIRPIIDFLRVVLGSDKRVVGFLKRAPFDVHLKYLVPNITALKTLGVSASNIVLLANFPSVMLQKHEQFMEAVDKVKEMGFEPLKSTFVLALRVFSGKGSKIIWDRCFDTYTKWGWSEDDILLAFKKNPICMTLSANKIDRAMEVFVNKMGYQSNVIAEMPAMLFFSLEKRILPRCSVIQVLVSKGLMKKISLYTILTPAGKKFLVKYVIRYGNELPPELMSIYRGEAEALRLQ